MTRHGGVRLTAIAMGERLNDKRPTTRTEKRRPSRPPLSAPSPACNNQEFFLYQVDSRGGPGGKASGTACIECCLGFLRSVCKPEGGFFLLKRALVLAVLCFLSATALAQNAKPPFLTVFAGYSYANEGYLQGKRSNLHGYEASVEGFHFYPHLTVIGDASAHYGWNEFPISCVTT